MKKKVTHSLKTWPEYYEEVEAGRKTFEVRVDDRGIMPGDIVRLQEWDPDPDVQAYTGRQRLFIVGYVLRGWSGLAPNHIAFSLIKWGDK